MLKNRTNLQALHPADVRILGPCRRGCAYAATPAFPEPLTTKRFPSIGHKWQWEAYAIRRTWVSLVMDRLPGIVYLKGFF